jgi:hypothetical protein
MIAGMGKTQEPGPDRLAGHAPEVGTAGVLPTSMTTFVGRERELDELRSLFRQGKRLVTLVGIGGTGRTRLATELGSGANGLGWTGVYLAELASPTPTWSTALYSNRWEAGPASLRSKRRRSTCVTRPSHKQPSASLSG